MDNQGLPVVPPTSQQPQSTSVQVSARAPESTTEEAAVPYRMIHQVLRGRYLLAIGFGLVLAPLLGAVGWRMTRPLYRGESLVRIAYDAPRLNQTAADGMSMEAFEAFMQSQQALLSSNRLLGLALQDPAWREKGYQPDTMTTEDLASELTIAHRGGTEIFKISYVSEDRQKAALAVQTVVHAYANLYRSLDSGIEHQKTTALETRRNELLSRAKQLDDVLRTESSEFGGTNLDRLYDTAVTLLTRVDSSLIDVRIAMAMAQSSQQAGQVATPRMSLQQMARFDPRMANYMSERERLEASLQELRLRGYGEEHSQVKQSKKQLETVADRIQNYALELQRTGADIPPAAATPTTAGQTPGLAGKGLEELKHDEANLVVLSRTQKEQMVAMGAKKMKLDALRGDLDKVRAELGDVEQRLRAINMEAGLSGRLSVLSDGELPLIPIRDRRLHMAAAGAMGGLFLPAVLLAAFGFMQRRYRYSDEATGNAAGDIPLLGILPQLPERMTDIDMAADAAQCLHQIRVMLQLQAQATGSICYLMTSACPGEGKTSLTAALALSFATAGARTLVIDADLIGQRLTRGYHLRDRPGVREAMLLGVNDAMICDSGVPGLSVLPAGVSDGRDACAVSHNSVRRLLAYARKQYDIVLIDSGPILGSLEAMVIAGIADGVVLTISRQQQKPLVDRAIRQLRAANARIMGLVFNKAERRDFQRSVAATSLRSIPANAETGMLVKVGVTSTSGFGSLVDSVRTYLPANG